MRYELKHLRVFVAVAEELNYHRAAERLSMAQPAVSRMIIELETRMGVRLLERTTRRVRLTEPGRYFLKEAQETLTRLGLAEGNVRLLASGTKGILRVGYTTITGHSLVPDVVQRFRHENPEVRLDLHYLTAPQQRDRIITGDIDAGFIEGSFQSAEITTRIVMRHQLTVLLPAGHRLAEKESLTVSDIIGEKLVMGTTEEWPTLRRIVLDAFQSAGHVMEICQEAPSLTGILGLVTAGVGLTVFCGLPRFCGAGSVVGLPLATQPETVVETHLAWRRANSSTALQRFLTTAQMVASCTEHSQTGSPQGPAIR